MASDSEKSPLITMPSRSKLAVWISGADVTTESSTMASCLVGHEGSAAKHSAAASFQASMPSSVTSSATVHSPVAWFSWASASEMISPVAMAGPRG